MPRKNPQPETTPDGTIAVMPEPTTTTTTGAKVYRVRDTRTGHHITLGVELYDAAVHAILDRPAVDIDGRPLPPKYAADLNERPGPVEVLDQPAADPDTQDTDQGEPIEDANATE